MSYLLDRKTKRNRFRKIILTVIILFFLIYFRTGITSLLSSGAQNIFRPVLVLGNNIGNNFKSVGSFFYSKKSLLAENENLKSTLHELNATVSNYQSVLDENTAMKEMLGRDTTENINTVVLSAILAKPNRSPYDTLLIDVGKDMNIVTGDVVFAFGTVPIGHISEVYSRSSKVVLFSSPGEETEVVVPHSLSLDKASPVVEEGVSPTDTDPNATPENDIVVLGSKGNTSMKIIGRGGGNFEMILPRDFTIEKGTEVHLPGIIPHVIGTIETIISDPRDAFTKALLVSPVNIEELDFVQVAK